MVVEGLGFSIALLIMHGADCAIEKKKRERELESKVDEQQRFLEYQKSLLLQEVDEIKGD